MPAKLVNDGHRNKIYVRVPIDLREALIEEVKGRNAALQVGQPYYSMTSVVTAILYEHFMPATDDKAKRKAKGARK